MPVLTVELTGPVPRVLRDGREFGEAALRRRQTRVALAVLVLERATPPSKDRLAQLLWPDGRPPTWETALRGTVGRVRALLVAAGLDEALVTTSAGVRLALPAGTEVDVEAAAAAVREAEQARAAGDHDRAAAAARAATRITQAPFLPDWDSDWAQRWRARLASWQQRALAVVAESALRSGDYPAAAVAAEDALAAEPYAEWAFRVLMRARHASGERAAALDVYLQCRRRLRDDLGVGPAPETEATYLTLLGTEPPGADLPLVGRRAELEALAAEWARARAGQARGVVIVGEPGAGKSRLAEEFAASVRAVGHLVLRGREDGQQAMPFRPFTDALAGYLAARGTERLDGLGAIGHQLARLRDDVEASGSVAGAGAAARWRLFAAVRDWLTSATRDESILLIVEDVHWATPGTVSLLRHLLDDARPARLLVVVTCRPADAVAPELAGVLAGLLSAPTVRRLEPVPLAAADVGELLLAAAGEPLPELAETIVRRTGGNALYVSEMIRHLQRRRLSASDTGADELPAAVSELVQLRLRSLGPGAREVLELAALSGEQVEVDVLDRACGAPAAVRTALSGAAALGLMSVSEQAVRFRHDLLRDAVAGTVPGARRATMHRRLAEAFDARAVADELPSRAYHWGCAATLGQGEAEQAVRCHGEAAQQALQRLSFERAVEHLEAASAILDAIDPAETRTAQRCDLQIALGTVMHDAGDPRYADVLRDAQRLADRLADPVRLARAALATAHWGSTQTAIVEDRAIVTALEKALRTLPPAERELAARVKAALALEYRWAPNSAATTWAMADEAVAQARATGSRQAVAAALVARHTLGYQEPAAQLADADELRRIAAELADAGVSCEAAVVGFDAWLCLGEVERADAEIALLERAAERAGLPYFRWIALTRRAGWLLLVGAADAERVIDQAAEMGATIGIDPTLLHSARSAQLLVARIAQGRPADAVAQLASIEQFAGADVAWQAAMALAQAEAGDRAQSQRLFDGLVPDRLDEIAGDQLGMSALMNLARAGARLGDPRTGLLTPRLYPRSGELSWIACFSLGPVDLALAWTAAAEGDVGGALQFLEAADALCARAGTRPWRQVVTRERACLSARA